MQQQIAPTSATETYGALALTGLLLAAACSGGSANYAAPVANRASPVVAGTFPAVRAVSTLAGSGHRKSVDGKGRGASFNAPTDIALDPGSGHLYVLEPETPSIRSVTSAGVVDTLTRKLKSPTALAFDDRDQHLYTASATTSDLDRVTMAGLVSEFVHVPRSRHLPPNILSKMAFDRDGTLRITDDRSGRIVTVTPGKHISFDALQPGLFGICFASGAFYVVNQLSGTLAKLMGDDQRNVAKSPMLQFTATVTYDPDNGSFYVADPRHNRILEVTGGSVVRLAGNGKAGEVDGSFADAEFNAPTGIIYDQATRKLYVTDSGGNTVRAITGV